MARKRRERKGKYRGIESGDERREERQRGKIKEIKRIEC